MDTDPRKSLPRRMRSALLRPVLSYIAKRYVAGESLQDARRVANQWAKSQIPCTLGYWDNADDTPRETANQYLACIADMQAGEYISIKLTALDYSQLLLAELAELAEPRGVRLHFDAMDPESAEPTRVAVEQFCQRYPNLSVGYTLPGRWKRSEQDAQWTVDHGLNVRVVKGQFPDEDSVDPREGYLKVVETLAGRGRHVAVATHDVELAEQCVALLRERGTSHELELLYGLPIRKSLSSAKRLGESVRIYVGYGKAHLPYAVQKVLDNPTMLLWLTRDLLRL
jgi:proline dehydrogenase